MKRKYITMQFSKIPKALKITGGVAAALLAAGFTNKQVELAKTFTTLAPEGSFGEFMQFMAESNVAPGKLKQAWAEMNAGHNAIAGTANIVLPDEYHISGNDITKVAGLQPTSPDMNPFNND